ncbi:MAG: thiamine phosphate synthase [Polyangiales bacterium]
MRALLVTDLAVAGAEETVRRARTLIAKLGDAVAFGVRDHDRPPSARLALARALIGAGARVIVHDRCDVALASGAHGVQLGERSVRVRDARTILGPRAWIGRSCHDEHGLEEARADGADGVTLSPLFASPGKGAPLGEARFAALRGQFPSLFVIALGGIDETNADRARGAGADAVAAIRAWLTTADPVRAVSALLSTG